MAQERIKDGIAAGRLKADEYEANFFDLHPPLDHHEALVEADRCYFCHDAPCMNACPTSIDIPLFIREISAGNALGAAKTIFDQNILGGMCARVCPTETLCEEVCVRQVAEGKPVKIGLLQRHATDLAMEKGAQFYKRAKPTGRKVAIVGAGPAGLACAHRLAMHGHEVEIFEAKKKSGGLNEFGIAAYKTTDGFAQAEVDYVTAIGGIAIRNGKALGKQVKLEKLVEIYDAVFLGLGLGGVNALAKGDSDAAGSVDAVEWIAALRQAKSFKSVPVGRRVVVIGGGMTAIDAAVQSRLLGADEVTVCYRGPQEKMKASAYEQEVARNAGVVLRFDMQPQKITAKGGKVTGMQFSRNGEKILIACDQVMKAIGQTFVPAAVKGTKPSVALEGGRIRIDAQGRTSHPKIWAGGDCVAAGDDLTVTAVAQGRDAAMSINQALKA
jgi:glutamate synthase (NADPH/NADH) small chain